MKFEPIYDPVSNDDERLDIHADPPGIWARVVVVGLWQNAKITRKRWAHAAVCGPLRTVAGIDLLIRNLLANPQIRLVIVDGPTAGVVGEQTLHTLASLWNPAFGPQPQDLYAVLGEDLTVTGRPETNTYDRTVEAINTIRLQYAKFQDGTDGFQGADIDRWIAAFVPDEDRPGAALRLPPPPPKANAPAPHGDPGERIVGRTLSEVWPLALHRIMRFGRGVPTQYGTSRECWNLVSVIRDPRWSLHELTNLANAGEPEGPTGRAHPVLGLTYEQVIRYYREELTGPLAPEGQSYGYGSRMCGTMDGTKCAWCGHDKQDHIPGVHEGVPHCRACDSLSVMWEHHYVEPSTTDQIGAVAKLLEEKPDTRAAYLTPWRADEDAGKESGRPCLVGVMFRAVRIDYPNGPIDASREAGLIVPLRTLHMTVWFRSHDYGSAYPQNIAGCCLWLCEQADKLGMAVGTLTCMSSSAHVYDKGWAKAEKVIEGIKWPAIRWDSRSSWRVERIDGPDDVVETCYYAPFDEFGDGFVPCGAAAVGYWNDPDGGRRWCCGAEGHSRSHAVKPLPKIPLLRATAFSPGPESDGKIIAVLEGGTPNELRLKLERSGLVTEIGSAMWVSGEIERVWGAS